MNKYLFAFLCSQGYDQEIQDKCYLILKDTVRQFQLYQTLKEKERELEGFAEDKLSKPGFWILTTGVTVVSTRKLILSGHNIMGIDSVNLKLGEQSEIGLTWSF